MAPFLGCLGTRPTLGSSGDESERTPPPFPGGGVARETRTHDYFFRLTDADACRVCDDKWTLPGCETGIGGPKAGENEQNGSPFDATILPKRAGTLNRIGRGIGGTVSSELKVNDTDPVPWSTYVPLVSHATVGNPA